MLSILHISDLHRSETDNITNDELISALVSDRNRYVDEDPPIRPPDAIVISGDIIQGVPLGTPDPAVKLADQYATADSFIAELTDRFVDGDRSKVVIIPGNHDIDWVTARSAMALVAADDNPSDLRSELYREGSLYRWDWRHRELFKIVDQPTYDRRLHAFWTFFKNFYDGVGGLLRVQPYAGANLYSFCEGRIGVAAFDSCYGNDCFAYHGIVPREVVARAHLDLTAESHHFELLIAVWHHNIEGPPYRTDYMDVDIVRGMIGRGFRIGLFGHQHRPEAVPHHIHLAERETMAIIGAGSLCAGARELPTGARRGYNIIEIADDMRSARVHMREANVANLFSPSPRPAFGGNSWTDLQWEPPADLMGRPIDHVKQKMTSIVEVAERAIHDNRPGDSIALLKPLRPELPLYGLKLLIEAARRASDRSLLIELLTPPDNIPDLVELIQTLIESRNFSRARAILSEFGGRLELPEPNAQELGARINAEELIVR